MKIVTEYGNTACLYTTNGKTAREKIFFEEASAKVPLPEVARIFKKITRKKEENLTKLQGLGSAQRYVR
jgi:hypothetical protein